MWPTSYQPIRMRGGSKAPVAAHRTSGIIHSVPSTGRGGTASTSGRGQLAFVPARAGRPPSRGVQNEAASLQQGELGLSDFLQEPPAEEPLTPRRIMNRRIKSCNAPVELATLVVDEIANFDNQNTSHALTRLAKMYMARTRNLASCDRSELRQLQTELRPSVEALTRRMHQIIATYDMWDTTLSLWAYAQLGHHDETAVHTLCEATLNYVPILKPVDCANTVVAFAYMDYMHPGLLRQIVTTVLDTMDDFSPGELAQVLWGFARLGCHPGDAFLEEAMDAVHRGMQQYSSQELVLVLWSAVRLGFKPGFHFLRSCELVLLQRLPHLTTCDICVSVWSLARLRYKAVRLMDEIPQVVGPRVWSCTNAELCALVSGFANVHHYHRVLLDTAAGVALNRLQSLSHQEVCVLLWTYGTFHHRPAHPEFGLQIAGALLARLAHFTPQGLAMTVKSLAQLQWRSEAVLAELVGAADQKLHAFKPMEMSQLLYGLSQLQCRDLNIFFAVVRRCIAILKNPQHPHYGHMRNHRVINSVIVSCQRQGYVPWTLIDFAESKGIRVKQPDVLSSRDEEDEGFVPPPAGAADPAEQADDDAAGAASAGLVGGRGMVRAEVEVGDGVLWDRRQSLAHAGGAHPAGEDGADSSMDEEAFEDMGRPGYNTAGEGPDVGAIVASQMSLSLGGRFGSSSRSQRGGNGAGDHQRQGQQFGQPHARQSQQQQHPRHNGVTHGSGAGSAHSGRWGGPGSGDPLSQRLRDQGARWDDGRDGRWQQRAAGQEGVAAGLDRGADQGSEPKMLTPRSSRMQRRPQPGAGGGVAAFTGTAEEEAAPAGRNQQLPHPAASSSSGAVYGAAEGAGGHDGHSPAAVSPVPAPPPGAVRVIPTPLPLTSRPATSHVAPEGAVEGGDRAAGTAPGASRVAVLKRRAPLAAAGGEGPPLPPSRPQRAR